MPEIAPVISAQNSTVQKPNILVFRDKLLLPSEGFIKTHYSTFDAANLVYLASQFGWRAAELDGQTMATASGAMQRFLFKQTGHTSRLADLRQLAPKAVHAHLAEVGRWHCRWHVHWVCLSTLHFTEVMPLKKPTNAAD